jgi:hypothetical protein
MSEAATSQATQEQLAETMAQTVDSMPLNILRLLKELHRMQQ